MHILITRPEPDATLWRAKLEGLGIEVSIDPLLHIEWVPPITLPLEGIQALIATSRNGLRGLQGSPVLAKAVKLPLYAVGPGTAELARELGFTDVVTGGASARALIPVLTGRIAPASGQLLHLSGDKLAFDLTTGLQPFGIGVERVIVYRSIPSSSFQPDTLKAFASGTLDAVALTSPLSAQTFVTLCQKSIILEHYQRLVYICLSQNIADAVLPIKPHHIAVAAKPNTPALFTLIQALAHTFVSHVL